MQRTLVGTSFHDLLLYLINNIDSELSFPNINRNVYYISNNFELGNYISRTLKFIEPNNCIR